MASVTCPSCRRFAEVPEGYLGKKIKCRCGEVFAAMTGAAAPTADMPARTLPGPTHGAVAQIDLRTLVPVTAELPEVDSKACPFCGETIKAAAVKCRHCSEFLDPALRSTAAVIRSPVVEQSPVYLPYEEWRARNKPQPQIIQQNVVVKVGNGYRVPHLIHLLLTLCTAGIWLPIWLIHSALNSRRA